MLDKLTKKGSFSNIFKIFSGEVDIKTGSSAVFNVNSRPILSRVRGFESYKLSSLRFCSLWWSFHFFPVLQLLPSLHRPVELYLRSVEVTLRFCSGNSRLIEEISRCVCAVKEDFQCETWFDWSRYFRIITFLPDRKKQRVSNTQVHLLTI